MAVSFSSPYGWEAELAIAVAAGLDFMRGCILTGARLWDTGDLDGGCAANLLRRAKEVAVRPILMGSGTNADNIADFLQYADGAIVGSSLKVDGVMENPVDVARVRRYVDAVRAVHQG